MTRSLRTPGPVAAACSILYGRFSVENRAGKRNRSLQCALRTGTGISVRTEQTDLRHLDFHRLNRRLLPRLDVFPDLLLDRFWFLLLLPAPLGPLLAGMR